MVAFNFSPEFVGAIERREKRQTLRSTLRAKVGDTLQLYTGQRTTDCRKIVDEDPVCIRTAEIRLYPEGMQFDGHWQTDDTADGYAQFDGFANYKAMYDWFSERYGGSPPMPLYEVRWQWDQKQPKES